MVNRCGAYHNVSNAKVSIRKLLGNNKVSKITSSASRCVYVPCIGAVRILYMFPQPLAVGVVNVALMSLLIMPHAQ